MDFNPTIDGNKKIPISRLPEPPAKKYWTFPAPSFSPTILACSFTYNGGTYYTVGIKYSDIGWKFSSSLGDSWYTAYTLEATRADVIIRPGTVSIPLMYSYTIPTVTNVKWFAGA